MNYRPITDTWILARPKVKYHGAYPSGFLHRARALLGVGLTAPVLHVCAGKVRDYPFKGFGVNDKTLDLDPGLNPDFLRDARYPFPLRDCREATCLDCEEIIAEGKDFGAHSWAAVLADPPYTDADANQYAPGAGVRPTANQILRNALAVVPVGGRVGILDYLWPQPPKSVTEVAIITVVCGRNNRARIYSVFERTV